MAEQAIYKAISDVMADIGIVGKNDVNKQQGFKYRGIDAVMNALNPAMIKHKVFCAPEVLERAREERSTKNGGALIYSICKIKYRFYTTDGSFVEVVTVGEGMDSGDKATNKAMAIAFKYACFQLFCIPTEDMMNDPDAESPEAAKTLMVTAEQLKKINDTVDEYAGLLENKKPRDVFDLLKTKYKFDSISRITKSDADTLIKQLETWIKKQKERVS